MWPFLFSSEIVDIIMADEQEVRMEDDWADDEVLHVSMMMLWYRVMGLISSYWQR